MRTRFKLLLPLLLAGCTTTAPAPEPPAATLARPATVVPTARLDEPRWSELFELIRGEAREQPGAEAVWLGDSITQGWRKHGDLWQQVFGAHLALNAGIWADGTEHLLWRQKHDQLPGLDPKLVVVLIGVNNGKSTAREIADGIEENVAEAQRRFPRAKVLVLGILPNGREPGTSRRKRAEAVNTMLRGEADGRRVHFLDSGAFLLAPDGTIPADLSPDALHLTRRGYELWAARLAPAVRKLLESP